MVCVIDNYDSFTYNLVQYLGELGAEVQRRAQRRGNGGARWRRIKPERIVISPGPGRPEDAGITMGVMRQLGEQTPILGVCLGHQAIGAVFGGQVVRAPACRCTARRRSSSTTAAACSAASASPFAASRYHSLVVAEEGLPADLEVTARTRDDRIIMGLRHRRWPVHGVQFHPESILTGEGHQHSAQFSGGAARLSHVSRTDRKADAARGPDERGGGRGHGRGHGGPRRAGADRRAARSAWR